MKNIENNFEKLNQARIENPIITNNYGNIRYLLQSNVIYPSAIPVVPSFDIDYNFNFNSAPSPTIIEVYFNA